MRTIIRIENGANKAVVKFNREWNEYCVSFTKNGKRLPNADYFTDDRTDALDTAQHMVQKGMNGKM